MIDAINSALSGLHFASAKFEKSAAQIVKSGTDSAAPASVQKTPAAPANAPRGIPAPPPPLDLASFASVETADLSENLVSLKEAETQYKASAKLLGSLNELQGDVLDILS